ncbi:MAG: TlyA family RNA methyltransferase [Candidatus Hermodarchaeota archaeon]
MKERIDIILVESRLVESRVKAQWLIKSGFVLVNGVLLKKPGKKVDNNANITLKKEFPYVGRGGLKLKAALNKFAIKVENKVCADIGASIGGFTDCLLKNRALKVYAIDTAKNILHPSLTSKYNRIIKLLGVDARSLIELDEKIELVTIDITFASLKTILPNVKNYLKRNGDIIVLVKPLFETNFYEKKFFKIITNLQRLKKILHDFLCWSSENGFFPYGITQSPILGKGGSIEFLVHFRIDKERTQFNIFKELEEVIDNMNIRELK